MTIPIIARVRRIPEMSKSILSTPGTENKRRNPLDHNEKSGVGRPVAMTQMGGENSTALKGNSSVDLNI